MTDRRFTRRQILGTLGSGTLVGIAGCLGIGTESSSPSSSEATTHTSGDGAVDAGGEGTDATNGAKQSGRAPTGLSVGERPPDFSLDSLDHGTVSLFPVQKPTVLSFIAVSCPSCKDQEVNLKPVHERYGDEVQIITISAEPNRDVRDNLREFKGQYGDDWIHVIGTNQVIRDYRITSMDTTYILDTEGRITYKDTSVTSTKTFEEQLSKLLNGDDGS